MSERDLVSESECASVCVQILRPRYASPALIIVVVVVDDVDDVDDALGDEDDEGGEGEGRRFRRRRGRGADLATADPLRGV